MNPLQEALADLCSELCPERAAVLLVKDRGLELAAAHGLDTTQPLVAATISLSVVDHVRLTGHPLVASDLSAEPRFADRSSAVISEVRAVLCAPFWGPDGQIRGLLYADTQTRPGAFGKAEMTAMLAIARRVEGRTGARAPRRIPQLPGPKPVQSVTPVPGGIRLRPESRAYFFRVLSALVSSGVQLTRSLEILARGPDASGLAETCARLSASVQSGRSLSASMAEHPRVFSPFHLRNVGVGEVSGGLHRSLARLADYEERQLALTRSVKRSLTYPMVLLALCLVMLLVVPPYLLAGQFALARQAGVQLPWFSRAMADLSSFLRHPLGMVVVILSLGLVAAATFRLRHRPPRRLLAWLWQAPMLGRIVRPLVLSRFAQALAVQLEAGVALTQALPQAAACANYPGFDEQLSVSLAALIEGQSLPAALARADMLPRVLVQLVEVGQETGRLPHLLRWLGEFYELQTEAALESFAAWLEPILMLGMGLIVAAMLLATMVPMVRALESL